LLIGSVLKAAVVTWLIASISDVVSFLMII
jgi:hypothetical protein